MGLDPAREMSTPVSTIVMVPRETFSQAAQGLADICDRRENGARILCVDAGAPPRVQQELERIASANDVALLRVDRYLAPNQARNLAMQHVTTSLAVFVDNDMHPTSGWQSALERCAVETGAAIVAPATLLHEGGRSELHQVGGYAHVVERDGTRVFATGQWRNGDDADDHRGERIETGEAEFHCMLVDCDWFRRVGGLDEELLSLFDHSDFCMRIRDAGGSIWVEPSAVISYGRPRFVDRHDRRYYVLRWSDEWNTRSGRQLTAVWRLDVDPYAVPSKWAVERRRYGYRPFVTPFNRIGRVGRPVVDLVDRVAQRRAVASWSRSLRSDLAPRFAHVASWQGSVDRHPSTERS